MIFSQRIGVIRSEEQFNQLALEAFAYQLAHNRVYKAFVDALGHDIAGISHYSAIPFLPVECFKTNRVYAGSGDPEITFRSSGTTGMLRSTHEVAYASVYRFALLGAFRHFYGDPSGYLICALTPSNRDNPESSLAYMIDTWIHAGAHPGSGFYFNEPERLAELLQSAVISSQFTVGNSGSARTGCPPPAAHCPPTVLLIGLTYALIDFAERFPIPLPGAVIMETGGMKGRRQELVREEVHALLGQAFTAERIHSEYGMTELLSQAYSTGEGKFRTPPWMKVLIRDPNDPLSWTMQGRTGGISVIDLANRFSCPFIATQDLGRVLDDGTFEVLGRFDHSDLRGCNLLHP